MMADLGPTYFECDCHSHMLVGNVASIDEAADGWKWIELAMWQQGSHRHPWGYRLRHIWHIIWRGTPYLDFTSFDAETARKLRDWLTEAAAQVEGTEVRGDAANMTVALASEVERLRGVVADAEEAKRAVLKWANTCDHVGCECDNTLADELPDDWMALAALEEG